MYRTLRRSRRMSATSSANFPHMRTRHPASASTALNAVPQLPVPKTATCSRVAMSVTGPRLA